MDRFQIGVHFVALAAAFALAVPIGWDREKRARSAGLRTFPLVAMASCGFVPGQRKPAGAFARRHGKGRSKA